MEIKHLDEKGLKKVFDIVSQKDKNLENDITLVLNGIAQELENKANKSDIPEISDTVVNADWNAEEGEEGYIKNKPVVEVEGEKLVYQNNFENKYGNGNIYGMCLSNIYMSYEDAERILKLKNKYNVVINNIKFPCECFWSKVDKENNYKKYVISSDNSSTHPSSTPEFLIVEETSGYPNGFNIYWKQETFGNNIELSIYHITEGVKQLNPSYLPIVQETGDSETSLMSQKAITEALANVGGGSLPSYPKSNQVYYTTTDNKILNDLGSDLKAVVKSNEYYENEMIGVITFNEDITQLVSFNNIAYADKSRIKTITLPEIVTTFSESQFNYMQNLESVNIPDNIIELPNNFLYSSKVRNINVPSKLKKIGNYAFYNCQLLESISFGNCENLSEIGNRAFQECKSLVYVNNLNRTQVNKINDYTFYRCTSLSNIDLSKILNIGDNAFEECVNLNYVNIRNINSLSKSAFNNCDNILNVYISADCVYNDNISLDSFQTIQSSKIKNNKIRFYLYNSNDYNYIKVLNNKYEKLKDCFHLDRGEDTYVYKDNLWTGTQEEYDAITTKDSNTFYFIKEEE